MGSGSNYRLNKHIRRGLREVEAAGGTWRMSADGHAMILDPDGRLVGKLRTSGKQTGDGVGTRRIVANAIRAIERAKEGGAG